MLDYEHLVNLTKGNVKPIRSKVIKGGYQYTGARPAEPTFEEGYRPKGVHMGRIDIDLEKEEFVEVSYIPEGYGLGSVESIADKEERFDREIKELKEGIEIRKKAAYDKGHKEGLQKGRKQGRNQVAAELNQMRDLLQATIKSTREYYEQVEEKMVEFSMMIARKVVGDAAEANRNVAVALAKEAIKQAVDKTALTLIVNCEDYETLKAVRADFMTLSEGVKEINIEVNNKVKPGGVILETVGGSIDATIETMLDEVHKALLPDYQNPEESE